MVTPSDIRSATQLHDVIDEVAWSNPVRQFVFHQLLRVKKEVEHATVGGAPTPSSSVSVKCPAAALDGKVSGGQENTELSRSSRKTSPFPLMYMIYLQHTMQRLSGTEVA